MGKDYLGQPLHVGDTVVFILRYNDFVKGQIETINDDLSIIKIQCGMFLFEKPCSDVIKINIINLDEIANAVEEKMTHMCGCLNCIETVKNIIKDDVKPFNTLCNSCNIECNTKKLIFNKTDSEESNL